MNTQELSAFTPVLAAALASTPQSSAAEPPQLASSPVDLAPQAASVHLGNLAADELTEAKPLPSAKIKEIIADRWARATLGEELYEWIADELCSEAIKARK